MPAPASHSLRRTLIIALVALGALAAIGGGSLILLTSLLHQSSQSLAETLEGVRVAEKIESRILLMDRTDDLSAASLAGELRQKLAEMKLYVSTDAEAESFRRTVDAVEAYILLRERETAASDERARALRVAYRETGALIDINLAQARAAENTAAVWDRRTDVIGAVVMALALLIVSGLVWHLQAHAFRPVFTLAETIDRFARGDDQARATEVGPTELREIAARFNAMADTLARQRHNRLAFLSGVAHDLRNPLSALQLAVEVLDRMESTADRHAILERVRRQVGRLHRMTADFMDAAQIEAGKFELQWKPIDARALVLSSVEVFAGTSNRHTIETDLPGDELRVRCDPHRLEQVLVNLVSNAIKYSPDGGRIQVGLTAVGNEAMFTVSDEGVGLTAEECATIFEPFRRSGRLQADVPGAGLGLSIVRRIVDAHRGRIEVSSVPGRGSTFRVSLAILDEDEGARTTRDESRSPLALSS